MLFRSGRKRGDRRSAEGGLVGATGGSDLDGFGGVGVVSTPWTVGPAAGAEGVGFVSNLVRLPSWKGFKKWTFLLTLIPDSKRIS